MEGLWSRALAGEEFTVLQKFGVTGREAITFEIKLITHWMRTVVAGEGEAATDS